MSMPDVTSRGPTRGHKRPLDRVLAKLPDATERRDSRGKRQWVATCPTGHALDTTDDRLLISENADGRVRIDCQAGCALESIVTKLGLKVRDLFPPRGMELVTDAVDTVHEPLAPAIRLLDEPAPQPLQFIVEQLFTAGEIGLLVGDGGSFKSTVALHIAGAIAGGYKAFNHFPTLNRPALVVSAEDSLDVVHMRLDAMIAGHEWDRERVLGNVHVIADPDASLADQRWLAHVAAEAKRLDIGYLVLDPLADLLGGDENSNSEARPVVKWARALAAGTGAGLSFVHHAGKAGPDRRMLDRIRGASAFASAARTILFFEYAASGVTVEHLKMSRAPRLETFVLTREIASATGNRAQWTSATLTFQSVRSANLSKAEGFVLAQISASPRLLTTNDLRKAGNKEGIRNEDIAKALTTLQARGRVDYEPAARGAKCWFPRVVLDDLSNTTDTESNQLSTLPSGCGQGQETTLPTLPRPLRAGSNAMPSDPAPPLRGAGRVAASNGVEPELKLSSEPLDPLWYLDREPEP
jgi:hypothetical protein